MVVFREDLGGRGEVEREWAGVDEKSLGGG